MLKNAYKINLLRVPRNLPSKVPVYKRVRPDNEISLYYSVAEEILEIISIGRPVLVIFNTIKQVEEFLYVNEGNLNKNILSIIQGVIPEKDRNSIKK
jgi:preprotein translocase subunit SecA